MAQLNDALVAYSIGGDDRFWLTVARGEFEALKPRIRGGTLDAADGSRDNIHREAFYAPVYALLGDGSTLGWKRAWALQQRAVSTELAAAKQEADPGPNVYSLCLSLALPLLIDRHLLPVR